MAGPLEEVDVRVGNEIVTVQVPAGMSDADIQASVMQQMGAEAPAPSGKVTTSVRYGGKTYPVEVNPSATPEELKSAAAEALLSAGVTDAPEALVQAAELAPIAAETPEQRAKAIEETNAAKARRYGQVGDPLSNVGAAFGRGFMEPRENDPFGLDPELYKSLGIYGPAAAGARVPLEVLESLYGGAKQATGQAAYELGLSGERPERIAGQIFEPIEMGSLLVPPGAAEGLFARYASAPRTAPALTREQQIAQSAQRQGIDLIPADVSGGLAKQTTGGVSQSLIGGPIIHSAVNRQQDQINAAVQRAAGRIGIAQEPVDIGEALQRGARAYSTSTSAQGERMYQRVEGLAGATPFQTPRGVAALDTEIARLVQKNDPTDPLLRELQRRRAQLTSDPSGMSYSGVTQVLSDLKRAHRTDELRNTDAQRVLRNVTNAMNDDVRDTLRTTGVPGAARLWDRANRFWAERVETIDDVLDPILGPGKSGEDVVNAFEAMARGSKGGVRRLGGVLREMPVDAANNLRATVINRLGRSAPGAQDDVGSRFSASTFGTNWNKLSNPAKNVLFGGQGQHLRDLNDIARVVSAVKDTRGFMKESGTGRAVNIGRAFELLLGAGTGIIPLVVLESITGAALTSPRLARVIARLPSVQTPAAANSFKKALAEVAVREPMVAEDVRRIQSALGETPPEQEAPSIEPVDETPEGLAPVEETPPAEMLSDTPAVGSGEVVPMTGPVDLGTTGRYDPDTDTFILSDGQRVRPYVGADK